MYQTYIVAAYRTTLYRMFYSARLICQQSTAEVSSIDNNYKDNGPLQALSSPNNVFNIQPL